MEMSIKRNEEKMGEEVLPEGFSLINGVSAFDDSDKTIMVKISAVVDDKDAAFSLTVTLVGVFVLEDDNFKQHIDRWAEVNAPMILYPYLREHVFSLTTKAGFLGTLLPLFQMPAFDKQDKA
jgi:preprotein translocase subunit SecB